MNINFNKDKSDPIIEDLLLTDRMIGDLSLSFKREFSELFMRTKVFSATYKEKYYVIVKEYEGKMEIFRTKRPYIPESASSVVEILRGYSTLLNHLSEKGYNVPHIRDKLLFRKDGHFIIPFFFSKVRERKCILGEEDKHTIFDIPRLGKILKEVISQEFIKRWEGLKNLLDDLCNNNISISQLEKKIDEIDVVNALY